MKKKTATKKFAIHGLFTIWQTNVYFHDSLWNVMILKFKQWRNLAAQQLKSAATIWKSNWAK